jgi:conjugal transfer ATP-binding protein TraC
LINFEANMDTSLFIYPMENERIMRVLRNKVGQMRSHIRVASEGGKARDPLLQAALQDAEELRDQLARGEEKFFQFGLYFSVYHEDEKALDKMCKQIQTILAGKMVMTHPAILRQEQALHTTLPQCTDNINITRNMNTSPLSSSFPFTSSDLTSDEGILYGLNRHNNSLVIFDRFSLPNANSVMFATSGAGKSYAVKLEIIRSLMMGVDVIVIDPEREYEALCQTMGGTYMNVSLNSDRRINPFDLPEPLEGYDVQPGDLLRSNVVTLEGLITIMLGGNITPDERALLEKAILDTYALKGITMDTEDPSAIQPPTMEDLHDVLSEMNGAESLTTRLSQFTTGIYSGIFNQHTNIDLGSGLVCFSIRDLEDGLRPAAMYVILNYIWNRVRSKLKKRMLVVDEAWSLMQHEDSAKFLYGLAKRCRKYYLGLTTITQDVGDFLKNDYGKAIVTNAAMQILLKQAPSAIDELEKVFNMTEGEKYFLLNAGQGEGIFFAGHKHVAIQVIASYSEDKIITTDPEEILKRKEEEAASFEAK